MAEERMDSEPFLSRVLPQFFPAHWLDEAPNLVFTEFPSRIRVGYVIRENGRYSYLMKQSIQEPGRSIEAIHAAALKNLDDLPESGLTVGKTPGGSEAFLADVDDNFRAARILLPRVQEVLLEELGKQFFLAIPCRDWFIAWSKDQEQEWQQRNFQRAAQDFKDDEFNLTPDILEFSASGFSMHHTQSV